MMRNKCLETHKIDGGAAKGGKDFRMDRRTLMPEVGQPANNYFIDY